MGNNEILTDAGNRTLAINRYSPDGQLVETVTGPLAGDFWEYQIQYPGPRTKGLQVERRRLASVEGGARVVIELTKLPPDPNTGLNKNLEKRWDVAKAAYVEREWQSMGSLVIGKSEPDCPPPLEKLEAEFDIKANATKARDDYPSHAVASPLMHVPAPLRAAQWPPMLVLLAQSELKVGNATFAQQLAQRELCLPTAPERS